MRQILALFTIFLLSTLLLFGVWSVGPLPKGSQRPTFPRDLETLRALCSSLSEYKDQHAIYTLILYSTAYIYKQTFAIPGSFFMNLLAGALFGTLNGIIMVCTLNCIGATFCYTLSAFFAKSLVQQYLADRLLKLRSMFVEIKEERDRIWMFLLSARIFPFTPHWFLNMASPFLEIPIATHASSVLIGLIPYNLLCVRAGTVLSEVHSMNDVLDVYTLGELFSVSVILFIVARVSKRRGGELEKRSDEIKLS